jgi:AbrB family looped-hinge helix DNA binding protein
MPRVTVSPKFQVVIPREVRVSLGLRPGEQLQVFRYGDRIELIPVRALREMRGFLKGIDTSVKRDPDRL